jgi:ribA/ribD-fused uncharacterized protein
MMTATRHQDCGEVHRLITDTDTTSSSNGSAIRRFTGDYAFLSNFAASPVEFADPGEAPVTYRSVEHGFQAAKTLDPAARQRLAEIGSPLTAKRFGRRVVMRDGWDELRVGVMRDLLRQKFAREPFRTQLLASGNAEIVEGNTWHDQLWGDCECPGHAAEPGENLLGRLLMEIRSSL